MRITPDWQSLDFSAALHHPLWRNIGIELGLIACHVQHDDGSTEPVWAVVDRRSIVPESKRILTHQEWEALQDELTYFYSQASDRTIQELNVGGVYGAGLSSARLSQPTRRQPAAVAGWVYVLTSKHGYAKIGRARVVEQRVAQLEIQLPFRVDLYHAIESRDYVWAEQQLHAKFTDRRANGEWFQLDGTDLQWLRSLSRLDPP